MGLPIQQAVFVVGALAPKFVVGKFVVVALAPCVCRSRFSA
jgi:hypothetical protein